MTSVIQYTLDNKKIKKFDRITDAVQELNINSCNISLCCTGKKYSAKGFRFGYANKGVPTRPKRVTNWDVACVLMKDGKDVGEFNTLKAAEAFITKETGKNVASGSLCRALKIGGRCRGYEIRKQEKESS